MGNYAACKKYTQKEKNQFTLLTRSNFSLIAKNCVGLGIGTLFGICFLEKNFTSLEFFLNGAELSLNSGNLINH